MNAIPTTTAAPILAIDLGKYKSVACVYDPATAQGSSPPSAPRYAEAGDALATGSSSTAYPSTPPTAYESSLDNTLPGSGQHPLAHRRRRAANSLIARQSSTTS